MSSRSRSLLFEQYKSSIDRKSSKKRNAFQNEFYDNTFDNRNSDKTIKKIGNNNYQQLNANEIDDDEGVRIEMGSLKPRWMTLVARINEELDSISERTIQLDKLYRRKFLEVEFDQKTSSFNDISDNGDFLDSDTEKLTLQISSGFKSCERTLLQIQNDMKAILDETDLDVIDTNNKLRFAIKELQNKSKLSSEPSFSILNVDTEAGLIEFWSRILSIKLDSELEFLKLKVLNYVYVSDRYSSMKIMYKLLSDNVNNALVLRIQEFNTMYRRIQSSYIKRLKGYTKLGTKSTDSLNLNKKSDFTVLDLDRNGNSSGNMDFLEDENEDDVFYNTHELQQQQVVNQNKSAIDKREKEINSIYQSMNTVAETFKQMQNMVIEQGTILDRIDYNIEETEHNVESGHTELTRAEKYQKKQGARKLIFILILIIAILLVFVFMKK